MDKLIVTDINAHMGNAGGIGICEEYQITGFQVCLGNQLTHSPLLLGCSGQIDAVGLEGVLHQTGAIEAAGRTATPDIGNANILLSGGNDGAAGGRGAVISLQGSGTGGDAGGLATAEE